jgi:hypothetical protein
VWLILSKSDSRARREKITLESFLAQAERVFKPYKIKPRRSDAVDWWAAYQIGQRVAKHFVKRDSKGVNRVFIVGDGKLRGPNHLVQFLTTSKPVIHIALKLAKA